jgi:IS605 OrfB family transposase
MILRTTIQGTIHNLPLAAETALLETARPFQAARRIAYQRLDEGQGRDEIDRPLRALFQMDARFARDAILEAEANRRSLRKLLPKYIANTTGKIRKAEVRLRQYRSGALKPYRVSTEVAIAGLERRLAKLRDKRNRWQAHLSAGTLPAPIFGSAAAFHARRKGKMTHEQWQARRRAQFCSRGERDQGRGNQHAQIKVIGDGKYAISIATLPMVKERLKYYSAELWVPEEKRELLEAGLAHAYGVRLICTDKGWQAHITVREEVEGEIHLQAPEGIIVGGLDCNADRLTVAAISPQGNLLARHTIWMFDLNDMRAHQAAHVISDALDEALDWLEAQGVSCQVVERLKLPQDHDTNHYFNRQTTKFRSTMVKLAIRKALRRGMDVVEVNPAYTSVIGQHKYADAYGMSGHEAAAFVIARRGQGRDERLPRRIVAQIPLLRERLMVEAGARSDQDGEENKYLKWAEQLAHWKDQHHWSLWNIWDKASELINP